MENSNWKYQEQIKNFANCPPSDYKPVDMIAFRWVFEDKLHPNNFLPPLAINPRRINDKAFKTDKKKCGGYALSFFDSLKNAKRTYSYFYNDNEENSKKFVETVGEYIAKVDIKPDDGIASAPNKAGHFDLHEFSKADLELKATWICEALE